MSKAKNCLLFCGLLFSQLVGFGQNASLDSLEKSITKRLLAHGYFKAYYGLSPMYEGNTEVEGSTDLDRRILFFTDHTFEELVFKDWEPPQIPEKCVKVKGNQSLCLLLSGEWKLMGENVLLKYKFELIYKESDLSNCLIESRHKRFKCSASPLCNFDLSLKRMFLYKKEELKEVGNLGYSYK